MVKLNNSKVYQHQPGTSAAVSKYNNCNDCKWVERGCSIIYLKYLAQRKETDGKICVLRLCRNCKCNYFNDKRAVCLILFQISTRPLWELVLACPLWRLGGYCCTAANCIKSRNLRGPTLAFGVLPSSKQRKPAEDQITGRFMWWMVVISWDRIWIINFLSPVKESPMKATISVTILLFLNMIVFDIQNLTG